MDPVYNSKWIEKEIYDYGWGNEIVFVKLPELGFDDSCQILVKSQIKDNRYGVAAIIE
ncbi:MAG TPA: hypothetical protein GX391_07730 [Firmicutes bacterium]|nr:hypothetical protein [Bacillota bacterium]HOQ23399.1 hypothetical protein [Bacillota bacterium]HPT66817.1 hypothetical protein [Bacillota bacterium]